ncbi:hypothetical protein A2U01_0087875, partial [Trifolium medium]|nr:hypothetical protein [Trifolium medium]
MNPIAKGVIKTKSFENFEKEGPIKSVKSFCYVHLHSKVATMGLLVKNINSFRGNT